MLVAAGCDPFEYDPGNPICYQMMQNILDICTTFFLVAVVCLVNTSADVFGFDVVAAENIQTKQIEKRDNNLLNENHFYL